MTYMTITGNDLIVGEDGVVRLPENLPAELTELNLFNCNGLTSLPENLPDGLTKLDLDNCRRLTSLPENLPDGLTVLNLKGCYNFTSLPENLPDGLTDLVLAGCCRLTSLPENLPAGLTKLDLGVCNRLTSLPENLPAELAFLNLNYCSRLTSLPENLPAELTDLHMDGCIGLILTQELIEQLSSMEDRGCNITYPSHFNLTSEAEKAEQKLETAIESFKTLNPDVPRPTSIKTLLHRFLTEGLGQRGSALAKNSKQTLLELVVTITPVLELFNQNPNHLEWAEEIAGRFLSGCVNQPVAGWLEISSCVSIATASSVVDKIDATKHLRALGIVNYYIASLPQDQKPGESVEVEAGNALFREVHKRLLENKDINQPWLGVPNSIAYEGTIRGWLTEEKVTTAYNQVKESLAQTPEKVAEYFCEGPYKETWAEIAFPNHINEIKNSFEQESTLLDKFIVSQNNLSEEEQKQKADLISRYPNQDGTEKTLKEIYDYVLEEKARIIATKVKELTLAAIALDLPKLSQHPDTAINPEEIKLQVEQEGPKENRVASQPLVSIEHNTQNLQPVSTEHEQIQQNPSPEVTNVNSCLPIMRFLRSLNPFSYLGH